MRRRKGGLLVVAVLAIVGLSASTVNALLSPYQVGYFKGIYSTTFIGNVMNCGGTDPINTSMVNKATFINAIKNYRATGNNNCGSLSPYNINRNQTGAEFVIQTMRGIPGTAPRPTSADVADWEDRINSSDITLEWDYSFAYSTNSGYQGDAGIDDDMFVPLPGVHESLLFKRNGTVVYALKANCANPVGSLPGLPAAPPAISWNVTAYTEVSDSDISPGQTTTFSYYVMNNGPSPADGVKYDIRQQIDGGAANVYQGMTALSRIPVINNTKQLVKKNTFTATVADVGKTYCRRIGVQPAVYGTTQYGGGTQACVTVSTNYDLYPGTNGTGGSYAPVPLTTGGTISLGSEVKNNGAAADRDSPYEVHEFVIPASIAKPNFGATFTSVQGPYRYTTADHVNNTACLGWLSATFSGKITRCTLKESGSTTFPAGLKALNTYAIDADSHNPGDWVCRFMSVGLFKYTVAAGSLTHRISQPVCVVIAKLPSVQVWGDDVRVGDSFNAALLNNNANVMTAKFNGKNSDGVPATFGSWAEYGIFAPAPNGIINSVSGGALSGAKGNTLDLVANVTPANGLTFANTDAGNYGKWAAARQIDSIESFVTSRYTEATADPGQDIPLSSINSASGVQSGDIKIVRLTKSTGPIRVKGTYQTNATTILITDQDVEIDQDINVKPSNKTITKLGYAPQIIIIARNIVVDEGVSNIDAWLIARPTNPAELLNGPNGKISTCGAIQAGGNYANGLNLSTCNKPLRINGAVMAKEVQFRRTYGSDKATGLNIPAETINLRADAYMWARISADNAESIPITTMTITELPPRF